MKQIEPNCWALFIGTVRVDRPDPPHTVFVTRKSHTETPCMCGDSRQKSDFWACRELEGTPWKGEACDCQLIRLDGYGETEESRKEETA